ncbi:DUF4954 domain-containing protein [Bacteroidia bacterium]|nr:DUF4954 domain-containing protein [Bacteroidia bacterium]GHV43726.1 DUF4954 domain-containing protein [Bacteroidia bacterium]
MRQLTHKEIATLVVYGCSADDWKNIEVNDNFLPDFVSNVHFSGKNYIGQFEKVFKLSGGIVKHSGIFNCHLHNVSVGDDVYINNIHNYIANYQIENEVFIENCDAIFVSGKTAFGNGTKVAVVNESGCRAIPMFEKLSASLAYMLAFYRNRTKFIAETERLVDDFASKQSSETGKIGKNAEIVNCGKIINVKIHKNVELQAVTKLANGTVGENCFVGEGVQASDFIFCSGAKVNEAANVERCFVGEGTQIDKGFSATDSAFFANCQMLNGEAVSVFAAPYTVSHHKSTLLIAGYFAFCNAGSAANQSNHLYKLGAVHQGITERGVKLASNSYIVFPAHIGAFTTVLGTHKSHPDIADFPFSYLIENDGESWLVPAAGLRSAGTLRDAQKWQKRDLRTATQPLDLINFELFNPYTIGKILTAIERLQLLCEQEVIDYKNVKISKLAAEKAIETYTNAVYLFIENKISKINEVKNSTTDDWFDLAGLAASQTTIENLISKVENGKFSLEDIQNQFIAIYNNYEKNCMEWTVGLLEKLQGKKINNFTEKDIENLQKLSSNSRKSLYQTWLKDAEKEFNVNAQIGYFSGDFDCVRGRFDENGFVNELKKQCVQ